MLKFMRRRNKMSNKKRIYTCCPHEGCGGFQETLSFLHRFGIEAAPQLDDDGHYLEFSLPKKWSLAKRRNFNIKLNDRIKIGDDDGLLCDMCKTYMFNGLITFKCECGNEFTACNECFEKKTVRCINCGGGME